MNFKEDAEPVYTTEPLYDLMEGGYIKPDELLEGADAENVTAAVALVKRFMSEAEDAGLIEVG